MTQTAPKFLGRYRGAAQCARCAREVTGLYVIRLDGEEVAMGRRCAARTMGWATTRVEMEAKAAEHRAETDRRRSIVATAHPGLAEEANAYQTLCRETRASGSDPAYLPKPFGACVFDTAVYSNDFWRTDGAVRYGTWQEYIAVSIAAESNR